MLGREGRNEYYARRAAEAADAASRAAGEKEAGIHRTLSSMYRVLADKPPGSMPTT